VKEIVDGRLYSTDSAELLAFDLRNDKFLYRTKKGDFFLHYSTLWQDEQEYIEPIDEIEAKIWYEKFPEHEIKFEEVFEL
jgi:hypothetical protein